MDYNNLLANKIVLVTSGAQGIGKAIAVLFAKQGATVIIADIQEAKLKKTFEELKLIQPKSKYYVCDMGESEQIDKMMSSITSEFDGVDILVNSVGVNMHVKLHKYTDEQLERVLNVNYKSALRCLRHLLPYMIEKKCGNIINISSIHSVQSMPGNVLYAGTKGAINAASRAIALDYSKSGIRINTICPGLIMSDCVIDEVNSYKDKDEKQAFVNMLMQMQPLEPGEPNNIANVALFLASEMSKYMTGQTIMVDGGASIKAH